MSLNGPRAILKRIVLANEGSWEVISRQIRLISRGMEPQTRQCSISTDVCDQRKQKADQMTEASSSSSPDRKRPRTEEMESTTKLQFSKMSENAYAPTRGSKLSAGFDLYSAYDYVIPASGKALAKTDIQIALPDGCYGRVAPRSGLAWKHFIDVGAGVIDQDYRGNVGVVMFNFNKEDFKVSKGDRIAQLICERIYLPELEEIKVQLDETERGAGGFGSTGVSLKETNGTVMNGSGDAKPTNGTEATTTNGTDPKTTNGTADAKATNGTDAVSTNGTEIKESS